MALFSAPSSFQLPTCWTRSPDWPNSVPSQLITEGVNGLLLPASGRGAFVAADHVCVMPSFEPHSCKSQLAVHWEVSAERAAERIAEFAGSERLRRALTGAGAGLLARQAAFALRVQTLVSGEAVPRVCVVGGVGGAVASGMRGRGAEVMEVGPDKIEQALRGVFGGLVVVLGREGGGRGRCIGCKAACVGREACQGWAPDLVFVGPGEYNRGKEYVVSWGGRGEEDGALILEIAAQTMSGSPDTSEALRESARAADALGLRGASAVMWMLLAGAGGGGGAGEYKEAAVRLLRVCENREAGRAAETAMRLGAVGGERRGGGGRVEAVHAGEGGDGGGWGRDLEEGLKAFQREFGPLCGGRAREGMGGRGGRAALRWHLGMA